MSRQGWYRRVVVLDREQHAGLKLDADPDLAFVADEVVLPIGLQEMEAAAQCYPIVFSLGEQPMPLAVMGVRQGQNLFVTPNRKWTAGAYIPAVVRNYPFVVIDAGQERLLVGVDTGSTLIGEDRIGAALFEEGDLSMIGKQRVGLCAAYRDSMSETAEFGRALHAAGVLEAQDAKITLPKSADRLQLKGYAVVTPRAFDALDDATLSEWRGRGWLKALVYHMASVGQWQRLIAIAGARDEHTAALIAGEAPEDSRPDKSRKRRSVKGKAPAA